MMAQEKSKMERMFLQMERQCFKIFKLIVAALGILHALCVLERFLFDMTDQTDQSGNIRNSPIPGISKVSVLRIPEFLKLAFTIWRVCNFKEL